MTKIDFDELTIDENFCVYLNGEPFNGLAMKLDDHGNQVGEEYYKDGYLEGPATYWYSTGEIERRTTFRGNLCHGQFNEYFRDGELKSTGEFENGVCLWQKWFNDHGELLKSYRVEDSEPGMIQLEIQRRAFGTP